MTMYDATNPANLPPNADVAGYGDGLYDNWATLVARFGGHARIEIDVNGEGIGNCRDIEPGDGDPAAGPPWYRLRRAADWTAPLWEYCDAAEWGECIEAYFVAGLDPDCVLWWVADYTGVPHFPTIVVRGRTFVAAACQYAGGITARFDTSCVRPGVFGASAPTPTPAPPAPPADPPPVPATTVTTWTDPEEGPMAMQSITVPVASGNGFVITDIPFGSWTGAQPTINGADPAADGHYIEGQVSCQDRNNMLLVEVVDMMQVTPTGPGAFSHTPLTEPVTVFVETHQ